MQKSCGQGSCRCGVAKGRTKPKPGSVVASGANKHRATTISKSQLDLGRLKRDTAADHDRVESLIPLMQPDLTEELYRSVLLRFLLFSLHGWESWAAINVPQELRPLLLERQRSHLQGSRSSLFRRTKYARASSTFFGTEATGKAASSERCTSSKGQRSGADISHVMSNMPSGYLRGMGTLISEDTMDKTGGMWREFQNTLEVLNDKEADAVTDAAKKMFSVFGEWMAR